MPSASTHSAMGRGRLDPEANVIVLFTTLKEERIARVKMALDTGATYTMIPWEVAEILGHRPELSKRRIDITTASGVERVPLITVRSIAVLGKEAQDVDVVVHDLPPRSYVDGLLGLSFLRHFKLSLDFRGGWVEIE